jgi:NAD(P)H-dependent flavin oxidoreductase YrpB (nitropropane dioxygenase family)
MTTSLRDLLRVERPILQAPMAGVQGSALTIAVSNAGGLGRAAGRHALPRGAARRARRPGG